MKNLRSFGMRAFVWAGLLLGSVLAGQAAEYGPLSGEFLAEGISRLNQPLPDHNIVKPETDWSMNLWVKPDKSVSGKMLLGGFGDYSNKKGTQRYLVAFDGVVRFWGGSIDVVSREKLVPGRWAMLTAVSSQGTLQLYRDGVSIASSPIALAAAEPQINLAPLSPWGDGGHFGGKVALFRLWDRALTSGEVHQLASQGRDLARVVYSPGAPRPWDPKAKTSQGVVNQKPETLPKSLDRPQNPGPARSPTAKRLEPDGNGGLVLAGPWKLIAAPKLTADGSIISQPGFDVKGWYAATVPGTVLTTLVDQGVYPDPFFGLNNLSIPETLNKQDYWYRVEFATPTETLHRLSSLTFEGINYQVEVWLNGVRLGDIKGAFIRGVFDVSRLLKPGASNALAVKVSPPPDPGSPHEQSIAAGAGPNGGWMCYDGPTFFCSEGWDWIPAIRDRNTGIWQNVILKSSGSVTIGDPQVVTRVPAPVGSRALVEIDVEIQNSGNAPVTGLLKAGFEGMSLQKIISLPPRGKQMVRLTPQEFPQLVVANPRLWWPNGYGKPDLYHLTLSFEMADHAVSDVRRLRFGMREISMVLTALSARQTEGRYEFSPAAARATQVVKTDHASIVDSRQGWVPTLAGDIRQLPGIRVSDSTGTGRFLELRINGTRIPFRGGNWGMDDGLKRVSRERLEPYIRLQREANFNVLRNWCGQSTEEALFDLCDEYGIMVLSEFWISTQWANVEPRDPNLFLANAADAIRRFRTHPSIVLWCGRNEGVPPEPINTGLEFLIRTLDGTRYYQPASVAINLAGSGPWKYIPPADYFVKKGLTTELGLPSPPSADAIRAMVPKKDLWPPNDVWAYHDWVPSGAMDVKTFSAALAQQLGAPQDLEDFVRKAQMVNYVSFRAMFEALNANLWKPSSGTFLWMSHPSWPSSVWQIYSWDYEPNASFFGVKKACEPIHVQMNLPDYSVTVSNTTTQPLTKAKVTARVYDLHSTLVGAKEETLDVPTNESANCSFKVDATVAKTVRFTKLELHDSQGNLLSENFYWQAPENLDYQVLNELPKVQLAARASFVRAPGKTKVLVDLANPSRSVALMTFLTLRDAKSGERILPAYPSDNYVSLLPDEKCQIAFEMPAQAEGLTPEVTLEGWNIVSTKIAPK